MTCGRRAVNHIGKRQYYLDSDAAAPTATAMTVCAPRAHHFLPPQQRNERWQAALRSWHRFAPRQYSDDDLLRLINATVPEHTNAVAKFRSTIERVDMARYALMYTEGGIYADADQQLVSEGPLREAACSGKVVLPVERVIERVNHKYYSRRLVVGQSLLLSPPRNPFWLALIQFLVARYDKRCYEPMNTGPDALTDFINTLCVSAAASPRRAESVRARGLLRNVSLEWGFGDGRITRHHATGRWRTQQSRAHQREHAWSCTLDYAALDRRRCASLLRSTYVGGFPPSPPEPPVPSALAEALAGIGGVSGVAWCVAVFMCYFLMGTVGKWLARR